MNCFKKKDGKHEILTLKNKTWNEKETGKIPLQRNSMGVEKLAELNEYNKIFIVGSEEIPENNEK